MSILAWVWFETCEEKVKHAMEIMSKLVMVIFV